jgi:hypothetical protein
MLPVNDVNTLMLTGKPLLPAKEDANASVQARLAEMLAASCDGFTPGSRLWAKLRGTQHMQMLHTTSKKKAAPKNL